MYNPGKKNYSICPKVAHCAVAIFNDIWTRWNGIRTSARVWWRTESFYTQIVESSSRILSRLASAFTTDGHRRVINSLCSQVKRSNGRHESEKRTRRSSHDLRCVTIVVAWTGRHLSVQWCHCMMTNCKQPWPSVVATPLPRPDELSNNYDCVSLGE